MQRLRFVEVGAITITTTTTTTTTTTITITLTITSMHGPTLNSEESFCEATGRGGQTSRTLGLFNLLGVVGNHRVYDLGSV